MSPNSNASIQCKKLQQLAKLCLLLLNSETNVQLDSGLRRQITKLYMACQIAELKINAVSTDHIIRNTAKNDLFMLHFVLNKMQKGLTNVIADGEMVDEGKLCNVLRNMAPYIGGACLADAVFLQSGASWITDVGSFIGGMLIGGAIRGQKFLNRTATDGLDVLKQYSNVDSWIFSSGTLKRNIRSESSAIYEIHSEIKTLFKELAAGKNISDSKQQYTDLLERINEGLENRTLKPNQLRLMTAKVKFSYSDANNQNQTGIFRDSLLSLLEVLGEKINERQMLPVLSEMTTYTEICRRCYLPAQSLESAQPVSVAALEKQIDTILNGTNWSSQIDSYSAIHQLKFLITDSNLSDPQKDLFRACVANKLAQIRELTKHRTNFDAKTTFIVGAAVFLSNIGTALLPLGSLAASIGISQQVQTIVLQGLQSLGTGAFNSAFFATTGYGSSWRAASTHANSTQNQQKQLTPANDQLAKKLQDFADGIAAGKNNAVNHSSPATGWDLAKIRQEITDFAPTEQEVEEKNKQALVKLILEFNVKYNGEIVPLIHVLQDTAPTPDARKKILNDYYTNALVLDHPPAYQEQFNTLLTRKKSTYQEAVLDYCKSIAVIAHSGDHQQLAMQFELTAAIQRATSDRTSNWFILNTENKRRNFAIRMLTGTLTYAAAFTVTAFTGPVVGFIAAVGLFTVKRLIDQKFANSYSTRFIEQALSQIPPDSNAIKPTESAAKITAQQVNDYAQKVAVAKVNEKLMPNQSVVLNSFVPKIMDYLEQNSYDQLSLLGNLQAISTMVTSSNLFGNRAKEVIIAVLEVKVMTSGKLKSILQQMQSTLAYDVVYGVIFGMVWASFLSPIIRDGALAALRGGAALLSSTQWTNYLAGQVFGTFEALISAPNVQTAFYDTLGIESDEQELAQKILTDAITKLYQNSERNQNIPTANLAAILADSAV